MNLHQLLSYRRTCLIHNLPLKPYCFDGAAVERNETTMMLHERGLSLCSHHPQDIYGKPSLTGLNFRYDGTFDRNDACPDWVVNNTIRIYMICDFCVARPITKSRGLGYTTLSQIRENQYYYAFTLHGNEKYGTYRGELNHEVLKHTRDGKFYHVDAYLQTGHAACRMGSCDGADTLDKMLNGFLNLRIPSLTKMSSLDQIVSKLKLYTLFS